MWKLCFSLRSKFGKTKSATGIDLSTAKWNLPKALNEDGAIDETKMPKKFKI